MKHLGAMFALTLAALSVQPASADPVEVGTLLLSTPWARATAPGAPTAAGYLTVTNNGDVPDRLIAAKSPVAGNVEIHEMRVADGVMTMRELADGVEIPPGGSLTLAPGAVHLMFMGLKEGLVTGETVPVTVIFANAGSIEVLLAVAPIGAPGPMPAHGEHGGTGQ